MNEQIALSEKISVNKKPLTEITIDGKKILVKHSWGKHNQDHPPTRLQTLKHSISNKLIPENKLKLNTAQITIEKYHEKYYPGFGNNAVPDLINQVTTIDKLLKN